MVGRLPQRPQIAKEAEERGRGGAVFRVRKVTKVVLVLVYHGTIWYLVPWWVPVILGTIPVVLQLYF